MANVKDDASTDVETLAKKLIDNMSDECAKLRKARLEKIKKDTEAATKGKDKDKKAAKKEPPEPPVITFKIDKVNGAARTPAAQAALVVKGTSKVCWGAHMADKARDILMFADGKYVRDSPRKVMGDDFEAFKKAWMSIRKGLGLKDAGGNDNWVDWDPFHVEMADSKIKMSDERVTACLDEYARLSRQENKGKNEQFETKYARELKSHIDKYTPKEDKKK